MVRRPLQRWTRDTDFDYTRAATRGAKHPFFGFCQLLAAPHFAKLRDAKIDPGVQNTLFSSFATFWLHPVLHMLHLGRAPGNWTLAVTAQCFQHP